MKKLLIIILILLALIIGALAYMGAFAGVEFEERTTSTYTLVYENYVGDYSTTNKVMDRIYLSLLEDGIETTKGFGIYFDNPQEVPAEECRSRVGCIVEPADKTKLEAVADKYNIQTWEARPCIVTEFPYKNQFSILLGIMKVYTAFEAYLKDKNIEPQPIMELYDEPAKKILYIMPLENPPVWDEAQAPEPTESE